MDLHAWVVCKDGSVWDPHFAWYDHCKEVWGCAPDAPTLREELTGDAKKQAWREIWKRFLRPALEDAHDLAELFRQQVDHPVPGRCFLNAWAFLQLNRGTALMKIGKMGWAKKEGGVHWEYG